jgi:hypothetical protein
MIPIGSIIALNAIEDNELFIHRHIVGTLIEIRGTNLVIEKYGSRNDVITIKEWPQELYGGSLPVKVHRKGAHVLMFSKTIILNRNMLLFGRPTWWHRIIAWIDKSKYKPFYGFSGKRYFINKKKLCGTVFSDGFFFPFGCQWLNRPLYFSKYDKTFTCKQQQTN